MAGNAYRTRLAPSPTGKLHLGHARTFWVAWKRAGMFGGDLVFRNEDLDQARCRKEFVSSAVDDIRWLGFQWNFGPVSQSDRIRIYQIHLQRLLDAGLAYPCFCSRRDILEAAGAPHETGDEPVYPGTCRSRSPDSYPAGRKPSIRFRVPDGAAVSFADNCRGQTRFVSGRDFGDFVIWRHDGIPSYQLAIVIDDYLMGITEVVRGEDLLKSTARQILLYQAFNWATPQWFHCPLMTDSSGTRLAKRHNSLSLQCLRETGTQPEELLSRFEKEAEAWWSLPPK